MNSQPHSSTSLLLSACLIVKNEEQLLPDCLGSIRRTVDEIVVVDTGSTDSTIAIAEKFGARVLRVAWTDDFAAARNAGLEAVRGRWILSIDADERLQTPELLLQAVHQADKDIGALLVRVISERSAASGRRDRVVNSLPRLYRNDRRIRWSGRIHEQIFESVAAAELKMADSGVVLEHLGYDLDAATMNRKIERNLRLIDLDLRDEQENAFKAAFLYFQRGKTLLGLGRRDEALRDFEKALDQKEASAIRVQLLNQTALMYLEDGRLEDAQKLTAESLELAPGQTFAHFVLGETAAKKGEHRTALDHFRAMQMIGENPDAASRLAGDFQLPAEQIYFRLGREFLALNQRDEAAAEFRLALAINPEEQGSEAGLAAIEAPLLSLSMIVKNEEKRLPNCLNSVRGTVDEIVIYDTGSTDQTIAIAEAAGARVIRGTWNNDFAAARNEALKHARGRWILYLDADEQLEAGQRKTLREMIGAAPENIGAFECTLFSPHTQLDGGRKMHTAGYPRLFRNYGYPTIKFIHRIHEQISPSIKALGKEIAPSPIRIFHSGYDAETDVIKRKMERNYSLLLQQLRDEPENAYCWFQMGQTLNLMGLTDQAEQAFEMALKLGKLPVHLKASGLASLSHINGQRRAFGAALDYADKSIAALPEQVFAHHLRAYALLYLERFAESAAAFEETLRRMDGGGHVRQTAFEIEVDRKLVEEGLAKARAGLK